MSSPADAAETATHPNVLRVRAAAEALGLQVEVRRFGEGTRTAQEAADAIGCPVGAIVKSLIFTVDGEVVLVSLLDNPAYDEVTEAPGGGRYLYLQVQ